MEYITEVQNFKIKKQNSDVLLQPLPEIQVF